MHTDIQVHPLRRTGALGYIHGYTPPTPLVNRCLHAPRTRYLETPPKKRGTGSCTHLVLSPVREDRVKRAYETFKEIIEYSDAQDL